MTLNLVSLFIYIASETNEVSLVLEYRFEGREQRVSVDYVEDTRETRVFPALAEGLVGAREPVCIQQRSRYLVSRHTLRHLETLPGTCFPAGNLISFGCYCIDPKAYTFWYRSNNISLNCDFSLRL